MLLLLLKSFEFDDDVALLLSVAGLVMGPHVTSESEIGGTESAALGTSWTCLRLCGSCVTNCTSFFRGSDPAICEAPKTSITKRCARKKNRFLFSASRCSYILSITAREMLGMEIITESVGRSTG